MKKIKIVFIFLLINFLFVSWSFCDDVEVEENTSYQEILASAKSSDEPVIYSKRAIVFERNSKVVLYSKNIDEKCPMASTTKILTCILILENCDLNETVTVSKNAAITGGSRLGLKENDTITINDLLYGLMLCSGNDCAAMLAEHLGGSLEGFSNIMNEKANALGLTSTHFVTPHGLDDPEHYTTAYELALITDYALDNENFRNIVGTKTYTITLNGYPKSISNTNELLGNLDGVYGVKTGFTGNAGRCLVTSAKRDNLDIITIVLGADTKKIRTQDSTKLINYVFENYSLVNLEEKIQEKYSYFKTYIEPNIFIYKGFQTDNFETELSEIKYKFYPLKKEKTESIQLSLESIDYFEAPIPEKNYVGKITVLVEDNILFSVDILNKNEIKRKTPFYYFRSFLMNYKKIEE